MTALESDRKALEAGRPYKLVIQGIETLYCTTIAEVCNTIRNLYPHAKHWQVNNLLLPWTAERVKQELPVVQIKIAELGNITYNGQVRGRKNSFATVYLESDPQTSWSFSWDTIAKSLNNNQPLRV